MGEVLPHPAKPTNPGFSCPFFTKKAINRVAFVTPMTLPLCNLFVRMIRRLGLETDPFGARTGTLAGPGMTGG